MKLILSHWTERFVRRRFCNDNSICRFMTKILTTAISHNLPTILSHPPSSLLWQPPPLFPLLQAAQCHDVTMCSFGSRKRLPLRLALWNTCATSFPVVCNESHSCYHTGHKHIVSRQLGWRPRAERGYGTFCVQLFLDSIFSNALNHRWDTCC